MDNKFIWVLQSRKFWAAVVGLVFIIVNAVLNQEQIDPNTVTNAILGIVAAYMGVTAWEDGKHADAQATVSAANVTAASQANVTTVSTPGESDVTVIAPTEGDKPAQPVIGRMGLE